MRLASRIWPTHVVDLVRAGVVQLVALEVDLRPAEMLGQPLGEIQRRGPAHIMGVEIVSSSALKAGSFFALGPFLFQLEDQRHQRFGDETAAEHRPHLPAGRPASICRHPVAGSRLPPA
jgi:hypothetical protein